MMTLAFLTAICINSFSWRKLFSATYGRLYQAIIHTKSNSKSFPKSISIGTNEKNSKKGHSTVSPPASLIYPIRYPWPPARYFCRANSPTRCPARAPACASTSRRPAAKHRRRRVPPCCHPTCTPSATLVGRSEVAFPLPLYFPAPTAARRNL